MAVKFTRDQLAKFLGDHESIRKFEQLLQQSTVDNPAQIITLFRLVQEALIDAGTADAKATSASDSLARIAQSLEVLASYPQFVLPRSFEIDYLDFNHLPPHSDHPGRVAWNSAEDTLNLHHSGGVTQQVGQELYGFFLNDIGGPISNGEVIGFDSSAGTFAKFIADGTFPSEAVIGIATQDIGPGEFGRATVWGRVRGIDTTGTPFGETWLAGDLLYASTTVAGGLTNIKPTAPNISVPMGLVRIVSSTVGEIAVRPVIEQQLYYGSFIKTADQSPAAINTAYPITWNSTVAADGISIGAPTSRIVFANAGLYRVDVSFQVTSTSASAKNIWLWYRKNGVDVANSSMIITTNSASETKPPSRSVFFSMLAGEYIELVFASDSTSVTLDASAATAFAPAAPAAILTITQEQQ